MVAIPNKEGFRTGTSKENVKFPTRKVKRPSTYKPKKPVIRKKFNIKGK